LIHELPLREFYENRNIQYTWVHKPVKRWRIIEIGPFGEPKSLFHGNAFNYVQTRQIPVDQWAIASNFQSKVRDGGGDRWYYPGFHVLPTLQDAENYAKNFRRRRDKLRIVPVFVAGALRDKAHSPAPVILASHSLLLSVDLKVAVKLNT